jgi:mannose-6-phosphate isomerase-like protein (cupin superfamily)
MYNPEKINKNNAERYAWGTNCDGWHLVKSDELSIIQERVPPGASEVKHYHKKAWQFFFILSGEATIEIGTKTYFLKEHEGIEVPPKLPHKLTNNSNIGLVFIIISKPKSHGDRVIV